MMRKLGVFFVLIILVSCSNRNNRTCENSALYGYVNICLPQIKGMTECKNHPNIQPFIQQYLVTGPVLGYYLNNETYRQIDSFKPGETSLNDYFMIYGEYPNENYRAAAGDLELMEKNLEQTLFEGAYFDQVSSRLEDVYNTLTVGKPALIEKYSPQQNVLTMIVLIKYNNATDETTVVSAVNCILLKNRLMALAYYIAYDGGKTIDIIKQKNNDAVGKLMKIN